MYVRDINPEAYDIYAAFKQKDGSGHIASPVGIQILLEIISEIKPKHILEVGGGIGALSYAALRHSDARVDIFEDQPFCLAALKKNLEGFENRYELLIDYGNFTLPRRDYDLVIIDGGGHAFVYHLVNQCSRIGRIMVEGGRAEQRKQARRALRAHYLFRPIKYADASRQYKGAHQIVCYRSNNFILRHLSYWFWEILIFTEIKNSLAYRFKKLLRQIFS